MCHTTYFYQIFFVGFGLIKVSGRMTQKNCSKKCFSGKALTLFDLRTITHCIGKRKGRRIIMLNVDFIRKILRREP